MRSTSLFLSCVLASLLALPAAPARAQGKRGASARLTWVGVGADRVERGPTVKPDGQPDGVFRLEVETAAPRTIGHVMLRSCDPGGALSGTEVWDTAGQRLWALGVERDGKLLRAEPAGLDKVAGRVVYDLYATKPLSGFRPGAHYCALVSFTDAMGVTARTSIAAPVRVTLAYGGRAQDRVGPARQGTPDGTPDLHLALELDTAGRAVTVRSLGLAEIDPTGAPLKDQTWDSTRGAAWLLGVEREGKRLNPRHQPLKDPATGKVTYHLYASPRRPLAGGALFQVTVDLAGAPPATAIVALPQLEAPKVQLAYVGMSADRVGERSPSGPDGRPDGHFRATVESSAKRRLTALVLRAVWPNGGPVPLQIWDTRPHGFRMIAVYRDGKALNPKDEGFSETVQGRATYDLFIHNTGWVRPDVSFQIEAVFDETDRFYATTKVVAAPARPITAGLSYQGFVADRVGPGALGRGDGKPDARFTFTVDVGGRTVEATRIELSVSDAQGVTWRKTWDTEPGGSWILGVERDGRRLNPTDVPVREAWTGSRTFTLWAAADAWTDQTGQARSYFQPGAYFTARVFFRSEPMVKATIRLP
jgi:hypothetical protein